MFQEKAILRSFEWFTEKLLCRSLFLVKLHFLQLLTLLKNRPRHRCFPVNLANFTGVLFGATPWAASDFNGNQVV